MLHTARSCQVGLTCDAPQIIGFHPLRTRFFCPSLGPQFNYDWTSDTRLSKGGLVSAWWLEDRRSSDEGFALMTPLWTSPTRNIVSTAQVMSKLS